MILLRPDRAGKPFTCNRNGGPYPGSGTERGSETAPMSGSEPGKRIETVNRENKLNRRAGERK